MLGQVEQGLLRLDLGHAEPGGEVGLGVGVNQEDPVAASGKLGSQVAGQGGLAHPPGEVEEGEGVQAAELGSETFGRGRDLGVGGDDPAAALALGSGDLAFAKQLVYVAGRKAMLLGKLAWRESAHTVGLQLRV